MKEYKKIFFKCLIFFVLFSVSIEACTTMTYQDGHNHTNTDKTHCDPGYYSLNCVCYKDKCPDNSELNQNSTALRECKCLYKFYKDTTAPNDLHCLKNGQACPTDFPYYTDEYSECSKTGCTSPLLKRTVVTIFGTTNYQCVAACNENEVKDGTNCVKRCSNNGYYYPGNNTCQTNCGDDFAYPAKQTCHITCETPLNTVDPTATKPKIYVCVDKTQCSDTGFPYHVSITNSCVKRCIDAKNTKIGLTKAYIYQDDATNQKKCVPDCSLTSKKYFKTGASDADGTCVTLCDNSGIINDTQCVTSCTNFVTIDTKECVEKCPYGYFSDSEVSTDKKCYKTCPYGKYHKYNDNSCLSFPTDPKKRTDKFIVLNDESRTMYTACPSTAPYYIEDTASNSSHICFYSSVGCSDVHNPDQNYIYSLNSKPYECKKLADCTGLRTENFICLDSSVKKCPESYPYNSKKVCYKDGCPDKKMNYYISKDSEKICYDTFCPTEAPYMQEGNCVVDCENVTYPFKINVTNGIGYCFKDLEGCFDKGYYYFDITTNPIVCSKTVCNNQLAIQIEPGTTHPYKREYGTCVTSCPIDYPYISTDNKTCYKDECPANEYAPYPLPASAPYQCKKITSTADGYIYKKSWVTSCNVTDYLYVDNTECKPNCPDVRKYYFLDEKKGIFNCKLSCDDGKIKTAYDPNTLQCLESCLVAKGNVFTPLKPFNPCTTSCNENEKYYDVDKKCIAQCNSTDYYSSTDKKRCVSSCEVWESIIGSDKVCTSSCPKFYVVNGTDKAFCCSTFEDCKKIVSNVKVYSYTTHQYFPYCPLLEIYHQNGVCYSKCPDNYPFFDAKNDTNVTCYKACSEAEKHFYIKDTYECVQKCPDDRKYVQINTGCCMSACPNDYPYYYEQTENGTTYYICVKACPENKYKALDNKCVEECGPNGYKQFHYLGNNTCLQKCPDNALFYENVTTAKNYTYYTCKDHCEGKNGKPVYISPSNECLKACPDYAPFIGKQNVCKKVCDPLIDGNYYRVNETITANYSYITKNCLVNCELEDVYKYKIYNRVECLKDRPVTNETYYLSPTNIYYPVCNLDPNYPFSTTKDNKKVCNTSCLKSDEIYYLNDKICLQNCSTSTKNNSIDENNMCVAHCHYDTGSIYKYEYTDHKCKETCNFNGSNATLYSKKDYKCINKCPSDEPFKRPGGECSSTCDFNTRFKFAYRAADTDDYECRESCTNTTDKVSKPFYFEYDYICLKNCQSDNHTGYNVQNEKKCVETCESTAVKNNFYLASTSTTNFTQNSCIQYCSVTDQPYTLENRTCSTGCKALNKYYLPSDKICLNQCPSGTYTNINTGAAVLADLNMCVTNCDIKNNYLTEQGKCAAQCDPTYGYVYKFQTDRICRKTCGNYYVDMDKQECLNNCPTDKQYSYDKQCIASCNKTKPYFVSSFTQGEVETQKICLTDCPAEYPFAIDVNSSNPSGVYGCYGSCDVTVDNVKYKYYLSNPDKRVTAKKCKTVCDTDYNYIGTDGECLKKCLDSAPFYVKLTDGTNKYQCYQSCPRYYAHETDLYECITYEVCNMTKKYYIDYAKNLCVGSCLISQYWGKMSLTINNDTKEYHFCLSECNTDFGLIVTPDKQCVKSCNAEDAFIIDDTQTKCLCKNLFYVDKNTGLKHCISADINVCSKYSLNYKYNIEGTKECASICKNLTTEDYICLSSNSTCPANSYIYYYPDGTAKCRCKYKYYKNENQQVFCLGQFQNCPSDKKLINFDTKECQSACPAVDANNKADTTYTITLVNQFCTKSCPTDFEKDGNNCKCSGVWYTEFNDKGEYSIYCLKSSTSCLDKHPLLVKATKECVDKCMNNQQDNNQYYILNGVKQCVDKCEDTKTTKTTISSDDPLSVYSLTVCRCNNLWYKNAHEENGVTCTNYLTTDHCNRNAGFYYQIKETKECVKECPSNHPYIFNDECFTDCKKGEIYGYNIEQDSNTKQCKCKKVWKKKYWDDNDKTPTKTYKYCIDSCNSTELEIMETHECIEGDKCPDEYPLKFNTGCYARGKCPDNSHDESATADKCICDNLWYYLDDTNEKVKYCMGKTDNECPISDKEKKYKIVNEKRCTKEGNCKGKFVFNFNCYENQCPEKTKINNTENELTNCKCDENYGYWFREMKEAEYLQCGIGDSCPQGKSDNINGTKECVHDCGQTEGYKYHFLDKCYKLCPNNLKSVKISNTDTFECQYRTLNDSQNRVELTQFASEDLKLYYTKDTTTDYVFRKHDVNLQIYGVNKNKLQDAENLRRADLSYIDLSKCIDKLYKSNNLGENDNIIVVKYDVLDTSKSYMINSVEYEFYSSKDYKKIDPSICEANSIVISYPVTYTVAKFDSTSNEIFNQYKKIFNLAKDLYNENKEYDIYNYTSPIYKDPCISLELDGKDLVLEDRVNYLYPASSTCENNCTFNNTDYAKERINCLCSPKEQFDINRRQPVINYNFSLDAIKDNQGGSSNLPVFNCMSRLDEKDKIAKNGAFYYMVFATAAQVCLVIISGAVGYGKAVAKISEGLQMGNSGNPPPKDGYSNHPNNQQEGRLDSRSNMKDDYNNQQTEHNNKNNNNINNNNQQNAKDGLITIKKISPDNKRSAKNKEKLSMYDDKNDDDDKDSENSSNVKDISSAESLFKEIKNEQRMLRFPYQKAIRIEDNGVLIMILASIFDKIYFTKTFFFLRKYDIFSAYLSLYILFHVLLLTITAFFFDIKTIKKIWNEKNFPGVDWYLLYGFITHIIVWIAYKLLNCLLSNNDKIENLIALKYNVEKREFKKNKRGLSTEELLYQKYQKVISQIKTKMIIYYVICFALFIFSFLYLTVFCAIYTGTKIRVFKCYGIGLLEILIIKIVYGIMLGAMRKTSIDNKIKCLYKFVRACSIYVS